MVGYVQTAESNYPTGFQLKQFCFTDKQYIGTSFDRVRRNIMYSAAITDVEAVDGIVSAPNETGQTLWSGLDCVPPDNKIYLNESFHFHTAIKNIDTNQVTFYNAYDPAQLVPEGFGAGGIASFTIVAGTGSKNGVVTHAIANEGSGFAATATLTYVAGALVDVELWSVGYGYEVGDQLFFESGSSGHIVVDSVNTGSDGETWGRAVSETELQGQNVLAICDPRTGNFWVHLESCELQVFRPINNYAMEISPLEAPFGYEENRFVVGEPVGVTADWTFYKSWRSHTTIKVQLTPSVITPDEVAADKLLAEYTYTYPPGVGGAGSINFRELIGTDANLYLYGCTAPGSAGSFELWKCEPGVGFTELTPWGADDGPNTPLVGWDSVNYSIFDQGLFKLPETDELVLFHGFRQTGKFRLDCIYYNLADETYDYHEEFVSLYMTADWEVTTEEGATWEVGNYREFDNDLEVSDFIHEGVDYSTRRMMFACRNMLDTGDSASYTTAVFVEYKFVSGQPPEVLKVIPETLWDYKYTAYQDVVEQEQVCAGSLPSLARYNAAYDTDITLTRYDNYIWDRETDSMWLSGDQPNFCKFNPLYAYQYEQSVAKWQGYETSAGSPFLKISLGGPVVLEEVLAPKDLVVPDCEADSRVVPIAPYQWSLDTPTDVVEGLWHLEGETVSIFADGQVVDEQVVENGRVTLPVDATRCHVGLKYVICATTLPVTTPQVVIEARRKIINGISVRVDKTGGVKVGRDPRNMYEMRRQIGNVSPEMMSGITHTLLSTNWEDDGQVHFRQEQPVPVTLLSIVLEVDVGDDPN